VGRFSSGRCIIPPPFLHPPPPPPPHQLGTSRPPFPTNPARPAGGAEHQKPSAPHPAAPLSRAQIVLLPMDYFGRKYGGSKRKRA